MKQRFFLALGALATCASLLLLGACDGHSWKDTQPLHQPHHGHDDDSDGHTDHDGGEGDHGGHEKKAAH